MKVEEVKKIRKALTHGGKFHSDDVFGAAFLKVINPDIEVVRSNIITDDFDLGIIVLLYNEIRT